uniref:Uncharacterized protein n=1 Tax=Mantoniella antarctica TaxID=81844 RepID=A0A7S0S8Y1_9CHLO|mmetsp:Transcript_13175/g.31964  ORF Transcript_13175/g.31964 Transcript_13175/m.31964 type:complete len:344 (+) Transcript_13175:133-1164(+)
MSVSRVSVRPRCLPGAPLRYKLAIALLLFSTTPRAHDAFSTTGITLASTAVKHQGVLNPIKYVAELAPAEVKARNKVIEYPVCNVDEPDVSADLAPGKFKVKDYVVSKLHLATTLSAPFRSSTYFCNLWPADMYANLTKYYPPERSFSNYAAKQKSCNVNGCRYAMDIGAIIGKGKQTVAAARNWPEHAEAVATWEQLRAVVFSAEFEKAMWKKLGVTKKVTKREIRIFSDKAGQSSGRVHTDQDARKVATMMLYITDAVEPMFDYGTCLHSVEQYRKRKLYKTKEGQTGRKDGESVCQVKFRYLPNTGYAFKVGPSSWHSAPNSNIRHWNEYPRTSVLVNWY